MLLLNEFDNYLKLIGWRRITAKIAKNYPAAKLKHLDSTKMPWTLGELGETLAAWRCNRHILDYAGLRR